MLPREPIRFDDRTGEGVRVGLSVKPPVLRRRTLAVLAGLVVAAVIYATLVPFHFQATRPLDWKLALTPPHPGDFGANILVYVPVGVFLRLVLRRRGSRWPTECLASVCLAFAMSYTAEVLQQWLPGRVPTLTDTLCNTAGAFAGTLMAPAAQRNWRQLHAWLYASLQTAPFTAASGLLTAFICVYALAPFDVHPTPAHVLSRFGRLQASVTMSLFDVAPLSPSAVLNKWMGAAAYGGLAFLLTMAARESGRSLLAAAWHAFTRSCSLVLAIEMVQLFTASHVADWQDMCRGWACGSVGTLGAIGLLWLRPLIYRDPAALVGPVVPVVCPVVLAWLTLSAVTSVGSGNSGSVNWLPVMGNFSRSWDALLMNYASGFLNYALATGALVLWLRLRGQVPRLAVCLLTGIIAALVLQAMAMIFFDSFPDTAHIALAVVAGGLVHRVDTALFGGQRAAA